LQPRCSRERASCSRCNQRSNTSMCSQRSCRQESYEGRSSRPSRVTSGAWERSSRRSTSCGMSRIRGASSRSSTGCGRGSCSRRRRTRLLRVRPRAAGRAARRQPVRVLPA
jgi:hypothetical protein